LKECAKLRVGTKSDLTPARRNAEGTGDLDIGANTRDRAGFFGTHQRVIETSGDTKGRLLEAATRIFGRWGFDRASIRVLAKEAGVNIAAVGYYFSSKEGLYQAVIEQIVAVGQAEMTEETDRVRVTLSQKNLPMAQVRNLLHDFVAAVLDLLLSERTAPYIRIMNCEQRNPTPTFDILYDRMLRPIHETLTGLVARLTGMPESSDAAILCAHGILGQAVIFSTHREAVLHRLKWKSYGTPETQQIIALVQRHTDAVIDSYVQKSQP
jgi:TetR/AcrR family transcriptional regulator, regulator of cefoperazone and chloramphenicol sensitivity